MPSPQPCERCQSTSHVTKEHDTFVSVPADSLDSLIEANSQPSLASLFKQAKDAGLVQPAFQYSSTSN